MKLFSSSSTAGSISSTASFDSKSATASCLAGILRRILCSGTLPTHPSDLVSEESASAKSFRSFDPGERVRYKSGESNAGLVARLMGLESMPETNFRSSISRSRSMNSADRLKEDAEKAGLHWRVRSTATIRESDEFLVLSFENASESKEFWSRERKLESDFGELKPRRRANGKIRPSTKKEDREVKRKSLRNLNGRENTRRNTADEVRKSTVCLDAEKIPCGKQNGVGSEAVKPKTSDDLAKISGMKPGSRTKKKKNHSDANSEDSSPVSVLNSDQFLVDLEAPKSGNHSTSSTTSRRKLSLETKSSFERQISSKDDNLTVGEEQIDEAKQQKRKYVGNSNVLDEIWRLSEIEFSRASWYGKSRFDHQDYCGIGEELEALILGELVEELVDEFD